MTRQPVEPLDPDSPRGREVAEQLARIFVDVRTRLHREAQARAAAEAASADQKSA